MKALLISILMILVLGSANAKPIRDVISVKEPVLQMEANVDDILSTQDWSPWNPL